MKLFYVTGNELKIKLAKKVFSKYGIEVIQKDMDTPEIQSLDCKVVADYSSKYAANILKARVLKNDSGLFIEALNGFPGALSKYAEDTIKSEGYIRLLKGEKNRNCHWEEVLSFAEPNSTPISFTSVTKGRIAEEVHEGRGYDFDKIFIPENDTRTFSEMTEEEQINCFNTDAYEKLAEYLKKKY